MQLFSGKIAIMRSRLIYTLYLFVVVAAALSAIELVSAKIVASSQGPKADGKITEQKVVFDPHLGNANPQFGSKVLALQNRGHAYQDGFALYNTKTFSTEVHSRPIILVLGGSTSDPLRPHSWPEYLAKLMTENGQKGTVVNAASGGYTSSQELFKLMRDGLEFKPDIIISYGGLRERQGVSPLPYPMVTKYQRQIVLDNARPNFPIMQNTILLFGGFLSRGYTYGLPTRNDHSSAWMRNMRIMHAVSQEFGANFCAILQPYKPSQVKKNKRSEMIQIRAAQGKASSDLPYVHDMTHLLDGLKSATEADGVHASSSGNEVIAKRIYELIFLEHKC